MSYHHFTRYEQIRIEVLGNLGYSNRCIVNELRHHHSSIDREIKRNSMDGKYQAEVARGLYKERRATSKPKGKWSDTIAEKIEEKLMATWSPEQIAYGDKDCNVSFKTIYNWLYQGKLKVSLSVLRRKGKSLKKADNRGKFLVERPVSERPESINERAEFGHWEQYTMVSSRGKSKGCLATFVERKTRLYTAIKISDRSANSMFEAISRLYNILPDKSFLTATTDRGKEFACFQSVENSLVFLFILQMPTLHGSEVPMKTLMDYCVNFILRKRI